VERIQSIKLLENVTFEPPDGDRLRQRAHDAFRLYSTEPFESRFLFPPHMRPYVEERTWHPSQKVTVRDDGSVELTLFTGGPYDIKRWILSFGSDIEVLAPDWLREQIAQELQRSLEKYQE
jgi:proteasome accessory factor B